METNSSAVRDTRQVREREESKGGREGGREGGRRGEERRGGRSTIK